MILVQTVEFDRSPSVAATLAKAAPKAFRAPDPASGLPEREARLQVTHDIGRLAAYDRVCGFTLRDAVPATWLHVQTFGLQMFLIAQPDFPASLAGIVHATNSMRLHRPVSVAEPLSVRVWAEALRPHRRGVLIDLVGEVSVDGELVWEGRSGYLFRGPRPPGEPDAVARLAAPEAEPSGVWRLASDLGRRYAAVSGDTNPIHLSPLTSWLGGFRRPIVHGMWTHARALAALEPGLPGAYGVDVAFTRPIGLPGKVWFAADRDGDATRFGVLNRDGEAHLVGRITA